MARRIAIWAGVGALVVALWSLYFIAAKPSEFGILWSLCNLTMPISLFRHYRMSVYFVMAVNAATYALVGTLVELWRRNRHHPTIASN